MKSMVSKIHKLVPQHLCIDDIYIVCIGSVRLTGDSFGPHVGTLLRRRGIKNVIGTVGNPLHAMNLQERLEIEVPAGVFTIAVDACLGNSSSVGKILVEDGPIRPGAGVGKDLPPVGNMSIKAIVNEAGFMEYFVLKNTQLHLVMNMAEKTARALKKALTLRTAFPEVVVGSEFA